MKHSILVDVAAVVGVALPTYPPSQPTGSLSVTQFLQAIQTGALGSGK